MITPELREYAELPDRFAPVPEGSSVSRFDDGRICIIQGANWASISAPRVEAGQVEALLAQTRELVAPGEARQLVDRAVGPAGRHRRAAARGGPSPSLPTAWVA